MKFPPPRQAELMRLVRKTCAQHGIESNTERIFAYMNRFEDKLAGEQLSLFDFT